MKDIIIGLCAMDNNGGGNILIVLIYEYGYTGNENNHTIFIVIISAIGV